MVPSWVTLSNSLIISKTKLQNSKHKQIPYIKF